MASQEPEAIPALAAWYATRHVERQESIAARVAKGLALLWPIINFKDIDTSILPWLHSVTLQIKQGWDESADEAFEFVQAARWSVEPDAPPLSKVAVEFPARDIQIAMRVTGPVEVKKQVDRAVPESDSLDAGKKKSTGVGSTRATDGGRSQVLELIRKEAPSRLKQGKVIGYARKTDSDPCYFCALLASQGAVYFTESSFSRSDSKIREVKWTSNLDKGTRRAFIGDGPAKVHDNCQCTMRPVYSKADSMDERAKFFLEQWNASKGEKDFRRRYVPPPPYSADVLDLSERKRIIAAVRSNREALMSLGFEAGSPNVKFLDSSISKLEAI